MNRLSRTQSAPIVPLPGRPANTSTPPQERRTRRLTDDEMAELPYYADLRSGSMAEPPRAGIPIPALLLWALIGGGLWLMIIHAVYAALTGDLSLKEF